MWTDNQIVPRGNKSIKFCINFEFTFSGEQIVLVVQPFDHATGNPLVAGQFYAVQRCFTFFIDEISNFVIRKC